MNKNATRCRGGKKPVTVVTGFDRGKNRDQGADS